MDKKSILIIDDDRGILDGFKLILERRGYLTDTATGSDAIEKVHSKYFNLALIDIKLPDVDGTSLLPEFHQLNPEMKKIIITGFSTRFQNAIQCLNLGADAYLEKPVTPGKLLEFVAAKLAEQEYETAHHEDTVNKLLQSRK